MNKIDSGYIPLFFIARSLKLVLPLGLQLTLQDRITSYNVCYTKLLRVMTEEILTQYNTPVLGSIPDSVVRYYAITVERRITHPAVLAVTQAAKQVLATEQ